MTRWSTLQSFRTDILVSHPLAHPWDTDHKQWGWKPWIFKESRHTGKQPSGYTLLTVQFPSQDTETFWLVMEHIHWASSHGFCSGESSNTFSGNSLEPVVSEFHGLWLHVNQSPFSASFLFPPPLPSLLHLLPHFLPSSLFPSFSLSLSFSRPWPGPATY